MEMIRIVPRKGEDEELFDVEKELGERDVTSVFGKSFSKRRKERGKKMMNMSGKIRDRERVGTVEKRKSRERRGMR